MFTILQRCSFSLTVFGVGLMVGVVGFEEVGPAALYIYAFGKV